MNVTNLNQPFSITGFAPELIGEIISMLPECDLPAAARVCKLWNEQSKRHIQAVWNKYCWVEAQLPKKIFDIFGGVKAFAKLPVFELPDDSTSDELIDLDALMQSSIVRGQDSHHRFFFCVKFTFYPEGTNQISWGDMTFFQNDAKDKENWQVDQCSSFIKYGYSEVNFEWLKNFIQNGEAHLYDKHRSSNIIFKLYNN